MAELRAGGLAIIIKSQFPENVGKAVRLIKLMGFNESLHGYEWMLTALSELTGTIHPVKAGAHALDWGKT